MEPYASRSHRRPHSAAPARPRYPLTRQCERPSGTAPTTRQQLSALAAATTRELSWGLACVAREVRRWWRLAERIPDSTLRRHAVTSLREKRPNTDGAALLCTLPRNRSRTLIRGLVAYEILGDYLDTTNEFAACEGVANGLQLNRALHDALAPSAPLGDYYRHHAWREDGGYLGALMQVTRDSCVRLPSFEMVRPRIGESTRLAALCQALNHELDPHARMGSLRAVAAAHFPDRSELNWFEWTGAASAWLTDVALLALAADPGRSADEARRVYEAYMPWISLAATMLDSYSDMAEDAQTGGQSFLANYRDVPEATRRVVEVLERSMQEAVLLDRGYRHAVIVASMTAMYLSKDGARAPEMREATGQIAAVGGDLTRLLIPVLRAWRVCHGLQGA